jgi:phosphatidylglycerol---prolipoprotein diacylglyceryl transferase
MHNQLNNSLSNFMLVHPQFNPVALQVGPLAIHWYGITYLVAFGLFIFLANRRVKQVQFEVLRLTERWSAQSVEDLLFYGAIGVVLGGRLGYCFFYKPLDYLQDPLEVLAVWHGGMSFHGGMLGVIVAMAFFAKQRNLPWLWVTDFIAPCVPTGLASGRLGNFINGELWGRIADPHLPWAMVFPQSGTFVPRHPSQIYQFLLEGMLLFIVLWLFAKKTRPIGSVSAVFLMGYGLLRFIAEYFREPDAFLGLLGGGLSMGQWLCIPMMLAGAVMYVWSNRTQKFLS